MISLNKVLIASFLLIPCVANAANSDATANASGAFAYCAQVMGSTVRGFSGATSAFAYTLLYSLALIGIVMGIGKIAMSKYVNLGYIADFILRLFLSIGFVIFLVKGVDSLLIPGFVQAEKLAGTVAGDKLNNISDVVDAGNTVAMNVIKTGVAMVVESNGLSMSAPYSFTSSVVPGVAVFSMILCCIVGIFLMAVFLAVGVNLIMIYLAFVFNCSIGLFLVGFMGSDFTKDIAKNWIMCCIGLAVNYYATILFAIAGFKLCSNVFADFASAGGTDALAPLSALFVMGIAIFILMTTIPRALTAIISHPASSLSALDAKHLFGAILAGTLASATLILSLGAGTSGAMAIGTNFVNGMKSGINGESGRETSGNGGKSRQGTKSASDAKKAFK